MCTGITYSNLIEEHFLARTMDFGFELNGAPIFCPRNYQWLSDADNQPHQSKYSLIGAGREFEKLLFADGVNEKGLGMVALYLPNEVNYAEKSESGQINLAPHEFLLWVLTNCASISELEERLSEVSLVNIPTKFLEATTPLHWMLTDKTGRTAVIEPTTYQLTLIDNPVGTLTNTPTLDWHLTNLRNYIGITAEQNSNKSFGTFVGTPFSQGSGTFGLPGGFTPPERFVRAAIIKELIKPVYSLEGTITNIWYILQSVYIPKGVVKKADGLIDYTQYISCMSVTNQTYFFTPYGNSQITQIQLTDELKNNQLTPLTFEVENKQRINKIN